MSDYGGKEHLEDAGSVGIDSVVQTDLDLDLGLTDHPHPPRPPHGGDKVPPSVEEQILMRSTLANQAPVLKKAYLLPKDHALHIPPHVCLSRLEDQLEALQIEVKEIELRNYEKDKGKKFEGSYTRVGFIMIITYFTLCGYMIAIGVSDPFLNAIVPTVGFNLSTWSLPWVKQIWMGLYDYNWGKPVNTADPKSTAATANPGALAMRGGAVEMDVPSGYRAV